MAEVDAELFCRAAHDIADWLGPREIQIAGGEPLLSRNLIALTRCAVDAGHTVTMTTNGFQLTGDVARELAEAGLGYLALSLDGFDHVHNKIRQREDAFALAQRAISHAHDNGLKIRLNCVICELNIEILQGFVTWVRDDSRLDGIFFQALVQPFGEPPRDGWWENEPLFPQDPERAAEVLDQLLSMKRAGFPILNPDGQFPAMAAYFRNPGRFAMQRCNVGTFGITVDCDGRVKLCNRYESIGNLTSGLGIREIAEGPVAEKVREQMRACRQNCHLLINCCFDEDAR